MLQKYSVFLDRIRKCQNAKAFVDDIRSKRDLCMDVGIPSTEDKISGSRKDRTKSLVCHNVEARVQSLSPFSIIFLTSVGCINHHRSPAVCFSCILEPPHVDPNRTSIFQCNGFVPDLFVFPCRFSITLSLSFSSIHDVGSSG